MNKKSMSKQEIIEWINLLYADLKHSFVKIGGYNFTFDQLEDIKAIKNKIESKITNVNENCNGKHQVVTQPRLNWQTMRLKQENKANNKSILKPIKLIAVNKHDEDVELSVEFGQLCKIYRTLEYMNDEVEHFKNFLHEEINNLKDDDQNYFFLFINDLFKDVQAKIKGEIK